MPNAFDNMKKMRNNLNNSSPSDFNEFKPTKTNFNLISNIVLVCLIFFIYFCWNQIAEIQSPKTEKQVIKKETYAKPQLQVLKSFMCPVDQLGTPGVCGVAKNNTNHYLSYAQIDINLYDIHHNLIATALANINNIPPGGNWQFMAIPLTINIPLFTSYEIVRISGW